MSFGASSVTAARCSSPAAMRAKITGNRRAARAASIRLYAVASLMCSRSTHHVNIEEQAASTYSFRASTSARCATSSAVSR